MKLLTKTVLAASISSVFALPAFAANNIIQVGTNATSIVSKTATPLTAGDNTNINLGNGAQTIKSQDSLNIGSMNEPSEIGNHKTAYPARTVINGNNVVNLGGRALITNIQNQNQTSGHITSNATHTKEDNSNSLLLGSSTIYNSQNTCKIDYLRPTHFANIRKNWCPM